ncbi:phospholipase D family protein [Patescibacteria group bacterium]|nr:phospholipase D family protein [Patescibacteria group bacterium]
MMDIPDSSNEEIVNLLKILSKPEALRILSLADRGIGNSTHAIEELNITQKIYYSRLNSLIESGLMNKIDGAYTQTTFGQIICSRFLPAIGNIFAAKDKLILLNLLEGTEMENKAKKIIEEELKIPDFERSPKVRILRDYEALAIEAIDLYDSAEESVILASNYADVRVMEAIFRATERGIKNSLIIGKKSLSSKLKQLRIMLSITFAKTIINFLTNNVNLKDFLRFIELPYTFCVMDGQRSIIEISNPNNEIFIVALLIDDRGIAEKFTEFYETLWNAGEFQSINSVFTSIGTKLNGETPH